MAGFLKKLLFGDAKEKVKEEKKKKKKEEGQYSVFSTADKIKRRKQMMQQMLKETER